MSDSYEEQDYGYGDDDNYGDEDKGDDMYQTEIGAYERVGQAGQLHDLLSGATTITDMQNKLRNVNLSPRDRFIIYVDAISRRLDSEGVVNLSEADINKILEKTKLISNLEYKNPVAYILGYIATKGGTKMDRTKIMSVIEKTLPKLGDEGGILPPDVIRYSRFWVLNL